MQSLSNKDPDRTAAGSFATLFGNRSSLWFSTKPPQLSLSKSVATELENPGENHCHVKLSEPQYQEQDSSSTLSSGKSHHEAATSARNMKNISFQPGFFEASKKREEGCPKPSPPCGNGDHTSHQVQMEHNQSLACISYPLAGSYLGRITAAYEPNGVVYPQVLGISPGRIILPLDYTEGIPIYVNAKQYHAILRRRQTRAKLEAQNKIAKSRKPYLHESRHLHALKRARGSGGRFLNTKNMQKQNPSTQRYGKKSELEIQQSESNSWGASTTSGSDVSCIFNNDEILQRPDLRVSISSYGVHSRRVAPDDRLLLSIDRCAQISTAT